MSRKSPALHNVPMPTSVRRPSSRQRTIPVVAAPEYIRRIDRVKRPYQKNYYAMYSSIPDAIVTDPRLMAVPFDDHMVNRGDGVFEVFLCRDGALYNLHAHLDRLERSAGALTLTMPADREAMVHAIAETVRAGGRRDCTVRVNVSRGPGGFGVNPAESVAPQLYIVAYRLTPPFMRQHAGGASAAIFSKPLRHFIRPVIKSCNYLFNVMMKMEATAREVDFTIARDEKGFLAEGATESLACVTRGGELLFPRPRSILRGTTAARAHALARKLVRQGLLRRVRQADISLPTVRSAAELFLFSTTITIAPVRELDGRPIGDGTPGPVAAALDDALEDDITSNPALRIPV